ncbi:MAG: 4Fe-4S binding protein [Anaerolineae bacterium]|nr:4Fe-4S binding protein [Anaerolineae bacterium]
MLRKVIEIDDGKCNGCGDCVKVCHEGAITLVNGKATLVSDTYCDGLGVCLPECPMDAIHLVEKEAGDFDESRNASLNSGEFATALTNWPVQLKLVSPQAPYFNNADLLIAADCTAFARGSFHRDFMQGRVALIGCPKLDDNSYYTQKISEILTFNLIKSIRVVRMEVNCCSGIVNAVKRAMLTSQSMASYEEIIIGIDGTVLESN